MSRKRIVLIGAAASLAIIVVVLAVIASRPAQPPVTTTTALIPSPSATPDPLAEADRQLLEQLSNELATKFRSFQSPNQAYVNSLKPYVTPEFLDEYRGTLRYADRVTFLQPMQSKAVGVTVRGTSPTNATAEVVLNSTVNKTRQKIDQTIAITWEKRGDRWTATDIETASYSPGGLDG